MITIIPNIDSNNSILYPGYKIAAACLKRKVYKEGIDFTKGHGWYHFRNAHTYSLDSFLFSDFIIIENLSKLEKVFYDIE